MKNFHSLRAVVATLVLVLSGTLASAQPATQPTTRPGKTIRLLTVGNSFAGNATRYLRQLAAADGNEVILGMANPGGCSLERHWKAVAAYEANPTDPAGLIYAVGSKDNLKRMSLHDLLTKEPWDYVTIQQASFLSDNPDTYYPYAPKLVEYIRQKAPTAQVLIHQTWAYRKDHVRYSKGGSPQTMHEAVRAAYHSLAEKLDLPLIPVGDAMYTAMSTSPFTPDTDFDPLKAVYPELPVEAHSFHVGWRWEKDRTTGQYKLVPDGTHANARGCYLGSAVFYEFLFDKGVLGNSFVPKELKPNDVLYLQQIAHETVQAVKGEVPPATQPTAMR